MKTKTLSKAELVRAIKKAKKVYCQVLLVSACDAYIQVVKKDLLATVREDWKCDFEVNWDETGTCLFIN